MSLSTRAGFNWNAAHDYFSPYNAILTSINVPNSFPNSGPANVQIRFLQSDVRCAFCISQANISSFSNAAIVKAILTDSLETTNENVIGEGAGVVCLPPTSRAFILKFSNSLI